MPLRADPAASDLWSVALADCGLEEGTVYHYWFEVEDTRPDRPGARILVTDPAAWTVDWRLVSPPLPAPYDEGDRSPAGVVLVAGGRLVACDPGGETAQWGEDPPAAGLRPNNRTVIYELPVQWTRSADENGVETAVGTFRDVLALVEHDATSPSFPDVPALAAGRSYLTELGVSTLELLPIADSCVARGWKYATSNYLAPDHSLGVPPGAPSPAANADLASLVSACHRAGLRFFLDAVMGFGRQDPYRHINFDEFHVRWRAPGDPGGDPEQGERQGWGGDLWRYAHPVVGYDPIGGGVRTIYPARALMLTFIARWILDQRIDGIRVDSVDTVGSWDFVGEFRRYARALHRDRAAAEGLVGTAAEARFLVLGEELSLPGGLVRNRLDALWNEEFKYAVRAALLGNTRDGDEDFEHTVRKLVDARRISDFADGAEVVNYVTSHDVGNWESDRLYNYLTRHGVIDAERRIKLAFACLFTAVGIPMIFAGEEFADQHDLPIEDKQTDPVNFNRLEEPWRGRIFDYVVRLVGLRHDAPALAVNDTEFIHVDLTPGRRVLAWRRGGPDVDPVVVVANFSDWQTTDPGDPGSEYVVANWPPTPAGRGWREVTRDREVPAAWVGREPLYAWEAKVYTLA